MDSNSLVGILNDSETNQENLETDSAATTKTLNKKLSFV